RHLLQQDDALGRRVFANDFEHALAVRLQHHEIPGFAGLESVDGHVLSLLLWSGHSCIKETLSDIRHPKTERPFCSVPCSGSTFGQGQGRAGNPGEADAGFDETRRVLAKPSGLPDTPKIV